MMAKLEAVLVELCKACSNVASGGDGVERNGGVGWSRAEREGITRPEGGARQDKKNGHD